MSTQQISFANNMTVQYTIKRRRYQRRINFIVHQDGALVVTAPKSCSVALIKEMLAKNEKWITKQIGTRQKNITVDERVVKYMKKALRPVVHAKLMQFNEYYKFTYNRVSIRHQKSRWGSCSTEGNLNFNCKLMCLSDELRDYVIVHELCHLQEMNHSQKFWRLVKETIPRYKELRQELKNVKI